MTPYDLYLQKLAAGPVFGGDTMHAIASGLHAARGAGGAFGEDLMRGAGQAAKAVREPRQWAPDSRWDKYLQRFGDFTERLVRTTRPPARKSNWGLGHTALLTTGMLGAGAMMGLGNAIGNQSAYGSF